MFSRIYLIVLSSIQSAIHNRLLHVAVWGMFVFVVGTRLLLELNLGSSGPRLVFDLGQGIIELCCGVFLILLLAHQFTAEISDGRMNHCFVRQLNRAEYYAGKGIGIWVALVGLMFLCDVMHGWLLAFNLSGAVGSEGGQGTVGPSMVGWLQIFILRSVFLLLLSSITLFIASFSRSFLFVVSLTALIWFVCVLLGQLDFLGGRIEGPGAVLIGIVSYLFPSVSHFDRSTDIWYLGDVEWAQVWLPVARGLCYTLVLYAVGIGVFRRRGL